MEQFKGSKPQKKQVIWRILEKHKFLYSVIVRTYLHKYNYDSLIRFFLSCSYSDLYIYNLSQIPPQISQYFKFQDINLEENLEEYFKDIEYLKDIKEYESYNPHSVNQILNSFVLVHSKIFKLMIGYPILIKAFLVLRFKIHKKDELYNFLIKKIKKNFSIAKSAYDNINSEYQKNLKPEDVFEPEDVFDPKDVFAPYAHLWTFCKNCETSIYKQYAQKNKYICQHCAFHLPMESFDRIESLIDSGTWDSTDENMVSTDPYEILRKNLASAYDEDANQNSKKSIKSEESTESEESQESEESTESEESQESEESTESEESQESEDELDSYDEDELDLYDEDSSSSSDEDSFSSSVED